MIKINGTREIKLLPSIRDINAKNISFGNEFAELTEDISKTLGKPQLRFTDVSDNKEYYIREIFTRPIDEVVYDNTFEIGQISSSYNIPKNFNGIIKIEIHTYGEYDEGGGAYNVNTSNGYVGIISPNSPTRLLSKNVSDFIGEVFVTGEVRRTFETSHSGDITYGWARTNVKITLTGDIEI